ncbi:MAG: DNA polymerase I [Epulopiscium sp. Nuni2H_MBin001]|nr:MAG: DNA polymerase I [Epulopiscium sp. Nuni2H_MBin001]
MKLLLIDGLSIANRAFYGIPHLSTKDGLATNAIYGFLNIMFSFIEKEKPDLLGIAFDVSKPTFRHLINEDYKGNRKGAPAELSPQIPVLKEVLDAMNIFRIEQEGFEADDLLGSIAKIAQSQSLDVVVVSGDKDLLQIATDTIEIKLVRTKDTDSYFAKDVIEAYGVTPTEFIDVKGLMGDSSDNIKGVPGVGEKTALKLIREYHSIENLYEHISEISGKKLKENLETYKEQALESKFLATIKSDIEVECNWEQFSYNLKLTPQIEQIFERLEFRKMLNRFQCAPAQKIDVNIVEPVYLENIDNLELAISVFVEDNNIFIGYENNYIKADLLEPNHHAYVKNFFESDNKKYIYNSKWLRHKLYDFGIMLKSDVFDIMIASYLLDPSEADYDLSLVAKKFLNDGRVIHLDTLLGTGKSRKKWSDLDDEQVAQQLGVRALVIKELVKIMSALLEEQEMMDLFLNIEMPLSEVLFDMELEGITIDPDALKQYGAKLQQLIEHIEQEIYEVAGEKFNINSSKQLGVILFEKMNIPVVKKTKTGYSTAADVLDKLKIDYPIVSKILEYRQYTKLQSTYVVGLLKVMGEDNKIHSTFNQTITATGRISSTEPNLQNIPIRMELGREIRKVFIPKNDDYIFLDADYSQIELRVLAAMSDDPIMKQAFTNDIDVHTLTASQVFNVPIEDVTSTQRYQAKAVNFGIVYGISAFALSEDIDVTPKEAQVYIDNYFENYPAIKGFLDTLVKEATMYGYSTTLLNRRRYVPELAAKNHNIKEYGKRIAMNMPIQGTSADIIKIAMVNVYKRLKGFKSKLILTVHDELLLEVYKPEQDDVTAILKAEMENAIELSVPLLVEVHSGNSWFGAK